ACLDIERRPELIFGNILKDDFTEVWKNGFGAFRRYLYEDNAACGACKEREFCGGGAFHSWDYDNKRPKVCFKGTLF
ncbi:MAG: radical SAM/SPASM domain-containing protein, partial [Lachnospiraceae bacterium]|nr:radical SAM/SPASM domain-containing protein [Lachnospiraceae bacterium]